MEVASAAPPHPSLVAAVHEAADGGGHPRALSGAHVGVEDVLLGDDVVVRPRAALERHRPAAKPVRGHPADCVSVFGVSSSRSTPPRNAAPISCVPRAPRTPAPSPPPRRSVPVPWPRPHSSQIHKKDRRPARLPPWRRGWLGAGGAGASGWGGGRRSSLSWARRGCARGRRAGRWGLGRL